DRSGLGIGMVKQEGAVGGNGEDGGSGPPRLAEDDAGAGGVDVGLNLIDVEESAGRLEKVFVGERGQAVNHAVGGQNQQAGAVHVDEGHHHEFVGSCAGATVKGFVRGIGGTAFVAVVERGFVAVMAVGDDQLFVEHRGLDRGNQFGIGDGPQLVHDSIVVGH